MIFTDTETIGFHGMAVLLQYAVDDDEPTLYSPWDYQIKDTLERIEWIFNHEIVAFNWTFDQFHYTKLYNVFKLALKRLGNITPKHYIEEIAMLEPDARFNAMCLKPLGIQDLFLTARKTKYQSMLDRKDIKIRKIPNALVLLLIEELNVRVPIDDIYFARKKDKVRWQASDIKDDDGNVDPEFQDVILRFRPSSALKAIIKEAFGIDTHTFEMEGIPESKGLGYAPYALAGYKLKGKGNFFKPYQVKLPSGKSIWNWGDTWVKHFTINHNHWKTSGKQYASDDIVYTRMLYDHLGCPAMDDVDSNLSCCVGNVRWTGFSVDVPKLEEMVEKLKGDSKGIPTAPAQALRWIHHNEHPLTIAMVKDTNKKTLAAASTMDNTVGEKCRKLIKARQSDSQVAMFKKIILAGRFHASYKVIGALSGRMSGADGFNAQGVSRIDWIRECFTLRVNEGDDLNGGDFDAFEMSIMDSVYYDPRMHEEIIGDKKIHGLWGSRYFFKDKSYEDIMASKGQENDFYVRSKNGVFAICYFGEGFTLITRVGVCEEDANDAYEQIMKDYPEFKRKRDEIITRFRTMRQKNGIGTKIEWSEPDDFVESLFDFKRFFTMENKITKALFDLAQDVPDNWKKYDHTVVRRDRDQKAFGATMSALFGAAFGLQGSVVRAAGNHVIQSTGSYVTKNIESVVWDFQPIGVHKFLVAPLNSHDEVLCSNDKNLTKAIKEKVDLTVESYREKIPTIKMLWHSLENWGSK